MTTTASTIIGTARTMTTQGQMMIERVRTNPGTQNAINETSLMLRTLKTSTLHRRQRQRTTRNGVAVIWIIISVPVLMIVLVMVTDLANLRLARIQAENAL